MIQSAIQRARISLEGVSVGDAFGQLAFASTDHLTTRELPPAPWYFTDDTEMAFCIVETLEQFGAIEQDFLAMRFAQRYIADPLRGYGPAMHRTLTRIASGESWRAVSRSSFDGMGSWGNGAAMRAGPIGAFFADDPKRAAEEAMLSAEVTHAHPEGIAGAIAVAVAASTGWGFAQEKRSSDPRAFLETVITFTPESEVRSRLERASRITEQTSWQHAIAVLGNGEEISAPDTVPFSLWCAAHHINNFAEALWLTVSALGDRDTTCAIVGSVVANYTGLEGIPHDWRSSREPLPKDN
jgi:ADP-ribosylglycohydrolase